ncbi:hypothetical protein IL330_02301 [Acinetobacter baumannii]|nr:hypothetical protein DJ41_3583 [Acinetobacter baumannii ATCC 19606 = CIP 70.34 = JCM 6841]MBN3721181.1 hypothetical protein [Acinetobacter baumannii]
MIGSSTGAFGATVSTVYVCVSLTLLLLPAASVNVTLASIVLSASAVKSLPDTLTVHVPAVLSTVAVYVWPLITTVTTVFAASAGTFFNTPVTVTLPDASDALITLSAVTESTVKLTPSVFGPTASTIAVPGNDGLPAGSVAIAVTLSPSFKPGFGTVQVPSGPATTVVVLPSG